MMPMKRNLFGCKTLEQILQFIHTSGTTKTLDNLYSKTEHMIRQYLNQEPDIVERLRYFKRGRTMLEQAKKKFLFQMIFLPWNFSSHYLILRSSYVRPCYRQGLSSPFHPDLVLVPGYNGPPKYPILSRSSILLQPNNP